MMLIMRSVLSARKVKALKSQGGREKQVTDEHG